MQPMHFRPAIVAGAAADPDATAGAEAGAALLGLLVLPPAAAAAVSAGVGMCLIASSTACSTSALMLFSSRLRVIFERGLEIYL